MRALFRKDAFLNATSLACSKASSPFHLGPRVSPVPTKASCFCVRHDDISGGVDSTRIWAWRNFKSSQVFFPKTETNLDAARANADSNGRRGPFQRRVPKDINQTGDLSLQERASLLRERERERGASGRRGCGGGARFERRLRNRRGVFTRGPHSSRRASVACPHRGARPAPARPPWTGRLCFVKGVSFVSFSAGSFSVFFFVCFRKKDFQGVRKGDLSSSLETRAPLSSGNRASARVPARSTRPSLGKERKETSRASAAPHPRLIRL